MATAMTLSLTVEQRQDLEQARDHHPLPYVRERAAAFLKVAAGASGRQVALNLILKLALT